MADTKDLVERLRSVHVRGVDCHCREAADELERLRRILEQAHEAFSYMPALHGAYGGATAGEIRAEVNDALNSYWSDLEAILGRAPHRAS